MPFAATSPAPTPSPTPSISSCLDNPQNEQLCDRVYDVTGWRWLAESADWLVAKPAAMLTVLVLAVVIRFLVHRIIKRLAQRAAEGTVPGVLAKGRGGKLIDSSPLLSERRKQRAETMSSVLRSVSTGI
ncbi:MAG: mechanosensitive ion channel family protein, partial [Actinomycetes bacterium]